MALIADAPLSRAQLSQAAPAAGSSDAPTFGQIGRSLLTYAAARLAKWREYRRTLNELQGLDDRTLRDLAMNRGGLKGLAREAAGYKD